MNTEMLFNLYLRLLFDGGITEYEDDSEYAPSGCVSFLTIHQSIPIGGMASVSISMQVLKSSENVSGLLENLERLSGIRKIRATGA